MRLLKIEFGALFAALFCSFPLFAQLTSGNIQGAVYDPSGATIPGARLVATNSATAVESSTTSTSAGTYRFENLPIGTYSLAVDATGFVKAEVNGINVELNQTVTSNVKLEVGHAAASVQVSESAVAIDTTTAQIQSTFGSKQIADLPTTASGSGVINLSLLSAGVTTSGAVGAGTGPSVGGQRPRNNNFTIEGIDNNSGSVTGPLVQVPNDAVAEFTSLQNQYAPEFGHSSGGQFNQVVKSGTNEFHGLVYEYFQNRNLNAADNLAAVDGTPLHPRFDDNRFGGTFGGPVKRNKLFFFLDYEYNPVGLAGSAGLLFAPTAAGYNTIASTPGINQTNLGNFQKYLGTAPTAAAPASTPKGAYPILSTLAAGPEYNQAKITGTPIEIGQVSIPTPSYANFESGVTSVDYNISDKDAVRGRFILNRAGTLNTVASLPVFFTTVPNNSYLITLSEYHNFSPNLINELRLGYNRNSQTEAIGNQTFPGLDQFPNIQFRGDLSGVQIGPNPSFPQYGYQNLYQLTDNVTLTKGTHSIKVGFDGERAISPRSFTQRSRGDYEYNHLSDYLFDFTPDYIAQRSAGNPIYWGNRYLFGWYGNDSWKVRPNLTVNLGLRYEYQTVPAGEQRQSLNAIASDPGLITFQSPQPQSNNLMPRVGIAYSPGDTGKTSIRAGFGINYDVLFDNFGLSTLPPQLSTTQDVTANGGSNFLANGGLPSTGPAANFTQLQARNKTSGFVPNVQRPKALQWNFGIEHEFGGNYVFETRYLGTRGINLPVQENFNRQAIVNASNELPVFWSMPSAAVITSLTNTLAPIQAAYNVKPPGYIVPAYAAAGFINPITAFMPIGNSIYHGWANQLTRRFSNGLQFVGAYTWSHAIDDSTAEVFSTSSTPRRPEDAQNLRQDRSSSALDHRNRFTLALIYDLPFFKHSNWLLKNVVGNWELAPIYTYQTGTPYTVQSGLDSNRNGDSAGDRVMVNPNGGSASTGSGATALTNTSGTTVGYVVNNPNAEYAVAPFGTLPTAGRNTARLNPTDDIDLSLAKRVNVTERFSFEFAARAINLFNHPQYTGGFLSDVAPNGASSSSELGVFTPTSSIFALPSQAFSSNPRAMVLSLKFSF